MESIARMLRGAKDYDALEPEEQAVVRACWSERRAVLTTALRMDQKFAAKGRPYAELGENGQVVDREPGATGSRNR